MFQRGATAESFPEQCCCSLQMSAASPPALETRLYYSNQLLGGQGTDHAELKKIMLVH